MKKNKIRVNFMIEPEINDRLALVAKYFKMSKSQFVNNYLDDLTTCAISMTEKNNDSFFHFFGAKIKSLKDSLEVMMKSKGDFNADTKKIR